LLSRRKTCKRESLIGYLELHKIRVFYCFPLVKKTTVDPNPPRPTNETETTSFKVIINSEDDLIFFNPDIWPEETIVSRWLFHERPPTKPSSDTQPSITQQ